jgi:hypothetical protein
MVGYLQKLEKILSVAPAPVFDKDKINRWALAIGRLWLRGALTLFPHEG